VAVGEEVGARLRLRDRRQFSAEAKHASDDVKHLGDESDKAGKKAKSAGTIGMGALSKGIKGLLKVAKFGVLGLGAIGAGIAVIGGKENAEAQKAMAQTNAVIKSTHGIARVSAGDISNLSKNIMGYSGLDDEVVQSGANMLLTFTNIRNGVGKGNDVFNQATGSIVDMAQAMHTDLRSASIRVGKALQDPIKGATALRRVGVMLTVSQQKQIKALVESGHMMEAQKIILRELNTEFGGSAKAYGKTFPGALARTKEQLKNLAGSVMAPLMNLAAGPLARLSDWAEGFATRLPGLQKKVGAFFGNIRDRMPSLMTAIKGGDTRGVGLVVDQMFGGKGKFEPVITRVAQAIKDVVTIAKEWAPVFLDVAKVLGAGLIIGLMGLANGLHWVAKNAKWMKPLVFGLVMGLAAYNAIVKVVTVSTALWNAVNDANPIILIGAAVIGLGLAFVYAGKHSETFRNVVMGVVHAVGGFFSGLFGWFMSNWPLLLAVITGPFGLAVLFVIRNWSKITGFFGTLVHGIGAVFSGIVGIITWPFRQAFNLVAGLWNGTVGKLSFHAPKWIPGIGGKGFSMPHLPTMHTGGITAAGGSAVIKPDEEVVSLPSAASVVPLPAGSLPSELLGAGGRGPITLQVMLDRKVIAQAVYDDAKDRKARR
jgi:hypothetical protein